MIKLKELSTLVTLCKNYGYIDLARNFNSIRSVALSRSYCDFTFECKQILESCDNSKYSKEFLNELSSIINNYPTDVDYRKIVNTCNSKTSNSKTLAKALYDEWSSLGKEDKHLIGIYKEMFISTLSRYELEVLTCKQLSTDNNGKDILIDCYHRTYTTPQTNAFSYDASTEMLTIAGKKNCKIRMRPKDVVAFMNSISAIKSNIWSPSCDDIKNTVDALRSKLIKENYKKLPGPIDCEVWGCFSDTYENLLMLEIIYPYTGSRHINVALDLGKF